MTENPGVPTVFLSCSGHDKWFVDQVHHHLLKGFASLYTQSFAHGDELISAMERNIGKSTIFCLFASNASLESPWVNFEIDIARAQKLTNRFYKVFVFGVGSSAYSSKLPSWLKQYWQDSRNRRPRDVARFLNNQLKIGMQANRIIGRGAALDEIERRLMSHIESRGISPNVFILPGVEQTGRTSLMIEAFGKIYRAAPSLSNGPVLFLSEDCDLRELYLALIPTPRYFDSPSL